MKQTVIEPKTPVETFSITRPWKKFIVVSCSHGVYADPIALDAVCKFIDDNKPTRRIHLGDAIDLSAFMGSADGEGDPLKPDIDAGLEFLTRMEVTDFMAGNHEARCWRDRLSKNELRVEAARTTIEQIETTCLKLHAQFYPYNGVFSAFKIADWLFTHGSLFNENAARDMAETYGNVYFGHIHKTMMQRGRTFKPSMGIGVGCLTRRGIMLYANTRRATLSWGQGFGYGEYCDDMLVANLHAHDGTDLWKLPS